LNITYIQMSNKRSVFLEKENVEMIWEVISDEDIMQNKTADEMNEIQKIFINDIRLFYNTERGSNNNLDLMSMNKKFIEKVLINLREIHEFSSKNQKQKQKQNLEAITAEDIQTSRQNEFEKEFIRKQKEFSSAMTMKVPEKPKFDDALDKPIGEMEELIARTLAQRNFDIEQIQQNIDKEKATTFLKSQDTSLKGEKTGTSYNINQNDVKYIKIGNEELPDAANKIEAIELQEPKAERRKSVSWVDTDISPNASIFSKLKTRPLSPPLNTFENNLKESNEYEKINSRIDDLEKKLDEILNLLRIKN